MKDIVDESMLFLNNIEIKYEEDDPNNIQNKQSTEKMKSKGTDNGGIKGIYVRTP